MRKLSVILTLAATVMLFANCHKKMYKNKEHKETTDVVTTPLTDAQLAQGKTIYDTKCGKCHDLPKTDNFTAKEWNKILPEMIDKANIEKDNARLVKGYVYAHVKPMPLF